ncbi:hypothetical protein [Lentzea sp. NPDC003310]|uniref:hypothetical protein n=1 Tax=Lentzea sp. NPDC003310 TaxID=3154447 RepID=UPI00339FE9E0
MSGSGLNTRGAGAFAAVVVASAVITGPFAPAASAERATAVVQQQGTVSTAEEKTAALRVIGLQLSPDVAAFSDQDFVIHLWERSDSPQLGRVRAAAARAFTRQSTDPNACYEFIVRGVFEAHRADLEDALKKAERDRQRTAAAAVVGWTELSAEDLGVDVKEFVFRIWHRSAADTRVRAEAEALLAPEATDEQRLAFIVTGIFVARDADRQDPPR